MSSVYNTRYINDIYPKTIRTGQICAGIGFLSCCFFYYVDLTDLALTGTLPWRVCGIFGALIFGVASIIPALKKHLITIYALMLTSYLVMMSGIGYLIFANPEANMKQEFAITTGAISTWIIVALIARGARRKLLFTCSILLILSFTIALLSPTGKEGCFGFLFSIFMMAIFALIFMYNTDTNDRERAYSLYKLEESRDQIKQQKQELAAINANIITFTHAMSHDLKGPLRRATSFLNLYVRRSNGSLPESLKEYLDAAQSNLNRGQQVIDDLLTYASIRQEDIRKQPIDLKTLCSTIVQEQLEALPQRKNISIQYQLETDLVADKKLCWHLISNLSSNAIKFTNSVDTPQITFGCKTEGQEKVLWVKDNGIGFDEDFKHQIGQPFKRFHGEEVTGTGVGLSIVRQIINLHQGRFWAESPPGKGAAFFCAFPATALA